MHLYFYARGVKHQVDMWKIFAQCQFFRWERTNLKTKKKEIKLIQGGLRPTIFGAWEYIFPEEALSTVLSMFGVGTWGWSVKGFKLAMLRKMFGAKKIPKKNIEEAKKMADTILVTGTERGLSNLKVAGVALHIIGIKKDKRQKWKESGYEQEML